MEEEHAGERRLSLAEAEDLIDRLHTETENYKADLALVIHDELGGLLVSAAMDFASARQRLPEIANAIPEKFDRGKQSLESAIDLSRRMIEELRPSILDNFGLFAALKWQLKKASDESGAEDRSLKKSCSRTHRPWSLWMISMSAHYAPVKPGRVSGRGYERAPPGDRKDSQFF
jgi:signal transduction histidine kinase